ncbi:1387_t:CDS:2, partial [Rhizophagus irregularis]
GHRVVGSHEVYDLCERSVAHSRVRTCALSILPLALPRQNKPQEVDWYPFEVGLVECFVLFCVVS